MKRHLWTAVLFLCIAAAALSLVYVQNRENPIHETVNLRDLDAASGMTAGELMTFDEMVARYAKIEGISVRRAGEVFGAASQRGTYRVYSVEIPVSDSYKPHIDFYCQVAAGEQDEGIQSICGVQLTPAEGTKGKKFNGTIDTWLRGPQEIEFIINGDFYNYAKTSDPVSLGAGITPDGHRTAVFTQISVNRSSHYAYCYKHGTMTASH